jgi:hypothetical protein
MFLPIAEGMKHVLLAWCMTLSASACSFNGFNKRLD